MTQTNFQSNASLDLTVVIPTFNRHDYLKRLLAYYVSMNAPFRFLVLDSSSDEVKTANRRLVESLPVSYSYIDFDTSISVARKLFEGLKQAQTDYTVFCADDDVLFVDTLLQVYQYVLLHPEYVCVDGIYLRFNPKQPKIDVTVEYANPGIDAEHPGARVFRLFQRYESLFYAVCRREVILAVFEKASELPSLAFQELFQAVAILLSGRHYRLPVIYAGRQTCPDADEKRDRCQAIYWFADNPPEFMEHYFEYRSLLYSFYQERNGKSITDANFQIMMDFAHIIFFMNNSSSSFFYQKMAFLWPTDKYLPLEKLNDKLYFQIRKPLGVRVLENLQRLVELAAYGWAAWRSWFDLVTLKKKACRETGAEWSCVLPNRLRWLSGAPDFRRAYLELCRYLKD